MDEQLGFSSSGKGALLPKPMADARTLPKRTNRRTMIRQDSIKRRPNKKAESESSASVSSSNSEPPENESQTEAQHRENMALFDQIVADSEEDEPELKAINRPTLRKASSMRSLSSSPETLETETSTLDSSSPKPYDPRPVQPLDKRPTLRRRESRRKREKIRRHNSLNDLVRQESLRGLDNRESPPEKTTPMYKSSHPISLLELMRRTSEIKFSNKSCLKKKNKDRPSSPKTVKFAIQRANIFVLVFSMDDEKSILEVENYYNDILELKRESNDYHNNRIPIVVVGNKSEGDVERKFNLEQFIYKIEQEWQCRYIEVSAKYGLNIAKLKSIIIEETRLSYNVPLVPPTSSRKKKNSIAGRFKLLMS